MAAALGTKGSSIAGPPVKLNDPLSPRTALDVPRFSADGGQVFYLKQDGYPDVKNQDLYAVPSGGGASIKLATGVALYFPSPDGKFISYFAKDTLAKTTSLYSVPSTGGPSVKLSGPILIGDEVFKADSISLSRDGGRILYAKYPFGASVPTSLYSISTLGGAPTLLARKNPHLDYGMGYSAISPNGILAVFVEFEGGFGARLKSVPLLGGEEKDLTPDLGVHIFGSHSYNPPFKFSPNGESVLIQAFNSQRQIYSVAVTGNGPPVQLSGAGKLEYLGYEPYTALFSADGSRVVYVARDAVDGSTNIFSVPSGGGESTKLNSPLQPGTAAGSPLISPDGTKVLFSVATDLFIAPITGGSSIKLNSAVGPGGGVDSNRSLDLITGPLFSPDGSRVIYKARHDADSPYELFSVSSSGGIPSKLSGQQVPGAHFYGSRFAFSPDGSRTIYVADHDTVDVDEVYIVPTNGGSPIKVSDGINVFLRSTPAPQFSPDGSRILFTTNAMEGGYRDSIYSRVVREHWDGGAGNWDAAANWDKDEVPDEVMQIAIDGAATVVASGNLTPRATNEIRLGGGAGFSTLSLNSEASITVINGMTIEPNGVLTGNGSIVGDLHNGGIVAPGASPGKLEVDGNFRQGESGQLHVDLFDSSNFDQLLVDGRAELGGLLKLSLGDVPLQFGGEFAILQAKELAGRFASVQAPALPARLRLDVHYTTNSVTLLVSPVPEPSTLAMSLLALAGLTCRRARCTNSHVADRAI